MEAKVKKFFSETFVKTYDYPFIVGFLDANGIDGVVPSLEQDSNRTCINYEMFKNWWNQNCEKKQPKGADLRVNNVDYCIRSEASPRNVKIEYIIVRGDNPDVINMEEVLDEFVKYNTKQSELFIFDRPNFKDLGYFIRKYIVSDIFE